MTMQRLLYLLLLLSFNTAHSQLTTNECGIYLTSNDYKSGHLFNPVGKSKLRQPVFHSKQVWLQTSDSLYKFGLDTLWGYRSNHQDWRVYNGEGYEIKDTGRIWIYEFPPVSETGIIPTTYFSVNGNAPPLSLSKQHLLDAYYYDTLFVKHVKGEKHGRSLFKQDAKTNHYHFEQWLSSQ